jgi:hypothetical protein
MQDVPTNMLRWLPLLLLFGACEATSAPVEEPAAKRAAPVAAGPVVIELFTSQGCSSCPPADRWLASLAPGDVVAGRPVIPLAFHVDYWNDLGWEDPLSSEAWTNRQVGYARRIEPRRGPYTPELVVGGGAHAVGSDRRAIERLVANAPPTSTIDAKIERDGRRVVVTATPPADARVFAAAVQDDVTTEIPRGENAGETLREDHVVRTLVELHDGRAELEADPAWRVVVLAADANGSIVAARALH